MRVMTQEERLPPRRSAAAVLLLVGAIVWNHAWLPWGTVQNVNDLHVSVSAGVQQESLLDAPGSPLPAQPAPASPQLITPQPACSPSQPSVSSPAAGSSPCPPLGAKSLDSCTSPPHPKASPSLCSTHGPPSPSPVDLNPREDQLSNCLLEEAAAETLVLNDQGVSCKVTMEEEEDGGESQRQAKEPPTDESQLRSRSRERGKELPGTPEQASSQAAEEEEVQGDRHWIDEEEEEVRDQSEAEEEEEAVSPVPELDSALDDVVMELMASVSPPATLHHLSSPSPPLFSRRGEGRALRPPPCSSGPSDDLSIRLRLSPFSTEASPETSPSRAPITPPPLSPSSPPLHSSSLKEFVPLSKVSNVLVSDFYCPLFQPVFLMTVLLVSPLSDCSHPFAPLPSQNWNGEAINFQEEVLTCQSKNQTGVLV